MNKVRVAKELLKLAREVVSLEFNTDEEKRRYQKEHDVRPTTKLTVKPKENQLQTPKEVGLNLLPSARPMDESRHVGQGLYRADSGGSFREILSHVTKHNPFFASVGIKEQYPDNWSLFVSKNRDATVAVKPDGDIVSVAKVASSQEKGWAQRAIQIAIKHGGDHLDCFETQLPELYAAAGMRPVARLKFNRDFAPPNWDYNLYREFNNGLPDVIFMAHDPDYVRYNPKDAVGVSSYEEGQAMQNRFLKEKSRAASRNKKAADLTRQEYKEIVIAGWMKRFGWDRENAERHFSKF